MVKATTCLLILVSTCLPYRSTCLPSTGNAQYMRRQKTNAHSASKLDQHAGSFHNLQDDAGSVLAANVGSGGIITKLHTVIDSHHLPPSSPLRQSSHQGIAPKTRLSGKDAVRPHPGAVQQAQNVALAEDSKKKAIIHLRRKKEKEDRDAVKQAHMSWVSYVDARRKRLRDWVNEVENPKDDYDGPGRPNSLTMKSGIRSNKTGAYDGLAPVGSGYWASDRPDEKRVDIDRKIYTFRQFRMKNQFRHPWTVEWMWKKLPTIKRVKKLGSKAFVRRFAR